MVKCGYTKFFQLEDIN